MRTIITKEHLKKPKVWERNKHLLNMKKTLTDWDKGFIQGFTCAVCVDIENHGMRTETRDLWKANKVSMEKLIEAGVDEHDIYVLEKHWEELNR